MRCRRYRKRRWQLSAVRFMNNAVEKVHRMSGGYPYVVQTFGFFAFETGSGFEDAIVFYDIPPVVMSRLSVHLFKDRLDSES